MQELKEIQADSIAKITKLEMEISVLQAKIANVEGKNDYLIHELECSRRSFSHHGLDGHAWIATQAIKIGRHL